MMPAMQTPLYTPLKHDIVCIDALYTAPQIACCYLIGSDGEYALIETGTARSLSNVMATLDTRGVSPEQLRYVIPTHVHLDHAGASGQLMQAFPAATLLIHPRGARHLIDPTRLIASSVQVYGETVFRELYEEIVPVPAERVQTIADGEEITLGRRTLRCLHTRGHAEHHFCLFDEQSHSWFSGDMFGISYPSLRFSGGAFVMPATTPTQFDPALYSASVNALAEAKPRHCYLTHFCALEFEQAQADMLCRQLQYYAALAEESESSPDSLANAVLTIAERELSYVTTQHEARRLAQSLRMDAQLNAQGIAWWRDHRSGKPAA